MNFLRTKTLLVDQTLNYMPIVEVDLNREVTENSKVITKLDRRTAS